VKAIFPANGVLAEWNECVPVNADDHRFDGRESSER
jgi:hypothetical protein